MVDHEGSTVVGAYGPCGCRRDSSRVRELKRRRSAFLSHPTVELHTIRQAGTSLRFLACAPRSIQVRLRAPSGSRLVLTALSRTSPRHVVKKCRLTITAPATHLERRSSCSIATNGATSTSDLRVFVQGSDLVQVRADPRHDLPAAAPTTICPSCGHSRATAPVLQVWSRAFAAPARLMRLSGGPSALLRLPECS